MVWHIEDILLLFTPNRKPELKGTSIMGHPWEKIDLNTYETHISSPEVFQLQTLSKISEQQVSDYNPSIVAILGVARGNGLDRINYEISKKVYCIDVNENYLDVCKSRYAHLSGILEFVCCDLSSIDCVLLFSNLHICSSLIEYLGEERFVLLLRINVSKLLKLHDRLWIS